MKRLLPVACGLLLLVGSLVHAQSLSAMNKEPRSNVRAAGLSAASSVRAGDAGTLLPPDAGASLDVVDPPTSSHQSGSGDDEDASATEAEGHKVNPTIDTEEQRVSRLSVDVGTVSYSLARESLKRDAMPEAASVRTEEFVNRFSYDYPVDGTKLFGVHTELFPAPHRQGFHVLRIGVKARTLERERTRPSHLVFVVVVPNAPGASDRLDLLKQALHSVVQGLDGRDRVSLVTSGGVVLSGASGAQKDALRGAVDDLAAGHDSKLQEALRMGLALTELPVGKDTLRHVILCTGGLQARATAVAGDLWTQVRDFAARGTALSTVDLGSSGRLPERIARQGQGRSWKVTGQEEARHLSVKELTGAAGVVALGTQVEVEFDPEAVARYRLMGYEHLQPEGPASQEKAGIIQAGQSLTALYEVQLGRPAPVLGSIRIYFKSPEGGTSVPLKEPLSPGVVPLEYGLATSQARLAWVAAAFAEKLDGSYWMRSLTWPRLYTLWEGLGEAQHGRREVVELGELILKAESLDKRKASPGDLMPGPKLEE